MIFTRNLSAHNPSSAILGLLGTLRILVSSRIVLQIVDARFAGPLKALRISRVPLVQFSTEFQYARSLVDADRVAARGALLRAARLHPIPMRGWGKPMIVWVLGRRGFDVFLRRRRELDRG